MIAALHPTLEIGSGLTGLAAILAAIWAIIKSKAAQDSANKAAAVSPIAMLEGLRSEVQTILDAYHEAVDRHETDRKDFEETLTKERARATHAESAAMALRGELATMRIDLAAARAEVADLRSRFEASVLRKTDS